ncbi:glycosyltransferase family 4 protein [Pseudoxanthomonas sp. UTMC 1351]|uniref:glycosyltransferase family 4 protein n=1 Tax=Pseudoxanthomonas sp. UTMC 1351 TaxID=2695853 RepID=UPI0034CE3CEB
MKVVHVVRQFHPSVGGMEEVVLNIARRHLEAGRDQVEVLTLDRVFREDGKRLDAREVHEGVPVRRLPYTGSTRYPLCPQVLGALQGADVVHVHGIDFFYDYLAMTRLLHGKPMIASTHGGFFHTAYASKLKKLWFGSITRASARAYRRIVATSQNDGDTFAEVVAAKRLRVIENGVDIQKFAGKGSLEPGKTIISIGRWSVNKGIPETLDLLQQLVAQDKAWRLIIAGREFDLTRADIAKAIATRGLQAHVDVESAPSQAELARLLSRAQYFVSLSHHEGFGIAAIEAMSAGLVPILSTIPPYAKLHAESKLGVLVDANAPGAAVQAILRLAKVSPDVFLSQREHAMRHVERYDWREVVDCYVDEYQQAFADTRRHAQ